MYPRRRHPWAIATVLTLVALGGLALIPAGPGTIAEAGVAPMAGDRSIDAIDALLGRPERSTETAVATAEVAPARPVAAALTTPEPVDDLALTTESDAPAIDPDLRRDAIGRSAVNMRAGPSTSTATITVLQPGQVVHVGADQDGWSEVTLEDGATGWVFSRYIASNAAAAPAASSRAAPAESAAPAAATSGTSRITASVVVRAGPSEGARPLFRTVAGETIRVLETQGGWVRIRTGDGNTGWVYRG
jgi:SH3-like domain-containing protein